MKIILQKREMLYALQTYLVREKGLNRQIKVDDVRAINGDEGEIRIEDFDIETEID